MTITTAATADGALACVSFAQPAGKRKGGAPRTDRRAASNDNRASDVRLDQFYTVPDVAEHCFRIFREHVDPASLLLVEPSAGTGSFLRLLPPGSLAFDLEPRYPGIETADFLDVTIESARRIGTIGNPPFGKNSSLAVRFFNHAAQWSSVIALILPRTFRKASIENRLDPAFHMVREEPMPANAFLFRSKPYSVPSVFQIWVRHETPRAWRCVDTHHPHFEFTRPDLAQFAIQRVGARAGRVHHDMAASPSSHHFIRPLRRGVERVMSQLDFAAAAGDVAGNPSIARSEIVALYRERTERRARA